MVSQETKERVQKAKDRHRAARDALASAQTEEIKAARELSDATRKWEHEYFANGGSLQG